MKRKKAVVYGLDRLRDGTATVMKDPVQKGDRIEWNGQGYLTRILRDGKPLYWLGQVVGWTGPTSHEVGTPTRFARGLRALERADPAQLDELVILHLMVEHAPGYIRLEELAEEGFDSRDDFRAAFVAAYGEERLWKPAWRIRCGVNRIFIGPTTHVVGTALERADPAPAWTGDGGPMTEDRLMTDELVVYRINIAPEVLPKLIIAKGVRMFEVVNGLPEDVYWLRSGWDYMRGCLYVEYANKNMEGLQIPDFYVMVTIIPEYRELSYQDWKRQIPKHEYDRLVLGNFYQDEGGSL